HTGTGRRALQRVPRPREAAAGRAPGRRRGLTRTDAGDLPTASFTRGKAVLTTEVATLSDSAAAATARPVGWVCTSCGLGRPTVRKAGDSPEHTIFGDAIDDSPIRYTSLRAAGAHLSRRRLRGCKRPGNHDDRRPARDRGDRHGGGSGRRRPGDAALRGGDLGHH